MKVTLSRKDALDLLLVLETKVAQGGDLATSVAIELGRASIKRVTELKEIRYVNPGNQIYMDVNIKEEPQEQVRKPAKPNPEACNPKDGVHDGCGCPKDSSLF